MMKIFLFLLLSISVWANIGNVMVIKGEAEVKRSIEMLKAFHGMELLKGDEIVTGVKSRVQVMLKDSTIITIGANSSFGFEDFSFDGTSESKVSMKASRGFFRSVTGEIGKVAPERFKVKTASATIGIRGTDFSGEIEGEIEIFKCYSGAITIEYNSDLFELPAGNMIKLQDGKISEPQTLEEEQTKSEEVTKEIEPTEISIENIADITQAPPLNIEENIQTIDETTQPIVEPFNLTPVTQDRPVVY